jgi:ABC-2 type transport system permease protein
MNDQPKIANESGNSRETAFSFAEPGVPQIRSFNLPGLQALYVKEVKRFFKVHMQTIWAPAITTLLFLVIFTLALGGAGRKVIGVPFADFIAPGLIMMAMLQNSFANSSFSLLVGKIQGTIVDYLMPPIGLGELIVALIGAAVTRAVLVGAALWGAMMLWPNVHVWPAHWWAVVVFALLGSAMLGFLGLLTSIWAEKFDHAAAVTNFVVTPLALLSGTFYSIETLAGWFQQIAHVNPVYHAIMGFRYAFIGTVDTTIVNPIGTAVTVLVAVNLALGLFCYGMLKSGWKIKP